MTVRRVAGLLALVLFLGLATSASADESRNKTDAQVAKKAKPKPKKLNLYGLNLNFTWQSVNSINTQMEGAEWIFYYKFKLEWRFGGVFFKKNKFFSGLRASAGFAVSNELVGTSSTYRGTSFSNPNYAGSQTQYLPIQDQDGYLSNSGSGQTKYQVSGADRRANYSDITLNLTNDSWYTIPKAKIVIDGGFTMTIPTSIQSRNKGLRTYLMTSLGLTRFFQLPRHFMIGVGYNFSWVHYFWKYDTPSIKDNYSSWQADNSGASGSDDYNYVSTSFNPHDAMSHDLWAYVVFPKGFGLYLGYQYQWVAPYQSNAYCTMDLGNGTTTNICQNTYDVRGYGKTEAYQLRDYQSFSMLLSYKILPYLKATAGFITQAPERKPDSRSYQQAFLVTNYNRYTMFAVYLTFYTDKFLHKVYMGMTQKRKTALEEQLE